MPELIVKKPYRLVHEVGHLLKEQLLADDYIPIYKTEPAIRFRGTVITSLPDGTMLITGWQRNIIKVGEKIFSWPTIIRMNVSLAGIILDINLDDTFKGSRGLLCSHNYLNENLKKRLTGVKLDISILREIKLHKLYCFHLVEVLDAMYCYYVMRSTMSECLYQEDSAYLEQETTERYREDNDLILSGIHQLTNRESLAYYFVYRDVFSKLKLAADGRYLELSDQEVDFYINDELLYSGKISIDFRQGDYREFFMFIAKCKSLFRSYTLPDYAIKLLNTNLYPTVMAGIFLVATATCIFQGNPYGLMQALSVLQRHDEKPVCLGGVISEEEAGQYFKGYALPIELRAAVS